jgi:hypothetical protein
MVGNIFVLLTVVVLIWLFTLRTKVEPEKVKPIEEDSIDTIRINLIKPVDISNTLPLKKHIEIGDLLLASLLVLIITTLVLNYLDIIYVPYLDTLDTLFY